MQILLTYSNLDAVVVMASTASKILCRAVSAPIVMSVPQKSLSIEPTCQKNVSVHPLSPNSDKHLIYP